MKTHLLDPLVGWLLGVHGEQPFWLALICLAAFGLGTAFILWGIRLDLRDLRRSEECGE